MLRQVRRDGTDQMIALGKAVAPVELLQTGQVKEKDGGIGSLCLHPFPAGFRQFIEIGHIGQAGHVVIIDALVLAPLRQETVQGFVYDALVLSLLRRVMALVGVPGQAETHPRLRIDAPAVGMQDDIIRVLQGSGAVYDIIGRIERGKTIGGVSHAGLVLRMGGAIHIVVHCLICVLQPLESEFIAKPL